MSGLVRQGLGFIRASERRAMGLPGWQRRRFDLVVPPAMEAEASVLLGDRIVVNQPLPPEAAAPAAVDIELSAGLEIAAPYLLADPAAHPLRAPPPPPPPPRPVPAPRPVPKPTKAAMLNAALFATGKAWCSQCELRQSKADAERCRQPWCKLKVAG